MAIPLQRLQGGLSSYHALQLVGGTHHGSGVSLPAHVRDGRVQEGWKEGGRGRIKFRKGRWWFLILIYCSQQATVTTHYECVVRI